MSSREDKVDKLRKLLALGGSPNAHEADAARRSAERFMRRHGLTRRDVEEADDEAYCEVSLGAVGWDATWRFALATVAARRCGVEVVGLQFGQRRKVKVCGARGSVRRAEKLFKELENAVRILEREAAVRYGRVVAKLVGELTASEISDSFRQGVVYGIARVCRSGGKKSTSGDDEGSAVGRGRAASGSADGGKTVEPDAPRLEGADRGCRALVRYGELAVSGDLRLAEHAEKVRERHAPVEKSVDLRDEAHPLLFELGCKMAEARVKVSEDGEITLVGRRSR